MKDLMWFLKTKNLTEWAFIIALLLFTSPAWYMWALAGAIFTIYTVMGVVFTLKYRSRYGNFPRVDID